MTRTTRRFAVPALAAVAAALPLTMRADGSVQPRQACAQSGMCVRAAGYVCIVNGVAYLDVMYVEGGG